MSSVEAVATVALVYVLLFISHRAGSSAETAAPSDGDGDDDDEVTRLSPSGHGVALRGS